MKLISAVCSCLWLYSDEKTSAHLKVLCLSTLDTVPRTVTACMRRRGCTIRCVIFMSLRNIESTMASPRNAFSILMKGKKTEESTPTRESSFIPCPLGCGKSYTAFSMSIHVSCCPMTQREPSPSTPSNSTAIVSKDTDLESYDTNLHRLSQSIVVPNLNDGIRTNVSIKKDKSYGKLPSTIIDQSQSDRNTKIEINAYSHLMKYSQAYYQRNSNRKRKKLDKVRQQRFHLHDASGKLSWKCESNDDISRDCILWESSVMIKQSQEYDEGEGDVELIISSSVQSLSSPSARAEEDTNRVLLVSRKSKLSVSLSIYFSKNANYIDILTLIFASSQIPVLKSILQKSIRRKRPLPSTKVAMELADKSLGDLLRRLPIIILEDSTLHPRFPFIVWLMVAESKVRAG